MLPGSRTYASRADFFYSLKLIYYCSSGKEKQQQLLIAVNMVPLSVANPHFLIRRNKKILLLRSCNKRNLFAAERTRISKPFQALAPQASVSTNSTTTAYLSGLHLAQRECSLFFMFSSIVFKKILKILALFPKQ